MDSMKVKPQVCFEVEKIIGVSSDGNVRSYRVQWAPAWVSSFQLVGCEHLIQEFMEQKSEDNNEEKQQHNLVDQQLDNQILEREGQIKPLEGDKGPNPQQSEMILQHKVPVSQPTLIKSGEPTVRRKRCLEQCEVIKRNERNGSSNNLAIDVHETQSENCTGDVLAHSEVLQLTGEERCQEDNRQNEVPNAGIQLRMGYEEPANQHKHDTVAESKRQRQVPIDAASAVIKIEDVEIDKDLQHAPSTSTDWQVNQVTVGIDDNGQHMFTSRPSLVAAEQFLENQVLIHTDLMVDHACHKCNKHFHSQSALQTHMRSHQSHCCSYCGLTFKSKDNLKEHPCEKQYPCKYCKKKFVSKQSLDLHTKKHRADFDMILCHVCNLWFPGLDVLEEHMNNTHLNVEKTETDQKTETNPS